MPNGVLRQRPLDIVTACRAADLRILAVTAEALRVHVPFKKLHVITARKNFPKFRRQLAADIELIDEDALIPDMTLAQLRLLPVPGFPRGAGWYFQQFLKLGYAFQNPSDDYYLIWDADTVPLRPMEFFDEEDRMLFATGEEEHKPYFETYRKLLREDPAREFSFITQHAIVQKSVAREMLAKVEANFPGTESWAWKIVRNLEGTGNNLFSEFETLGHYVKNHYPARAAFRRLAWQREGSLKISGLPKPADLRKLAEDNYFAAFESSQTPLRMFLWQLRRWLVKGTPAFRYSGSSSL